MLRFQRAVRKLSLLILSLCILSLIAVGGAAGADALADDDEQIQEETLAEEDELSEEEKEYFNEQEREKRLEEDEDNTSLIAATSATAGDTDSTITPQADAGVDVGVAVSPPASGTFGSNDTVDIWVGAFNDSSAIRQTVEDEEIEVTITGLDTSFSENLTTDKNGRAHVPFDLQGRSVGEYTVEVDRVAGDAATSISFNSGPVVDIMTNRDSGIFVGETTNISLLVRDGEFGKANAEVQISVDNRDTEERPIINQTFETNEDGFIEVPITPGETGYINVDAELLSTSDSESYGYTATNVTLASGFEFGEALYGEETVYGGYLRTANGMLRNENINISIITDKYSDNPEIIHEEQITTGDSGFFLLPYETPENLDTDDLYVEAETADGRSINIRFDRLEINRLPEDGGGGGGGGSGPAVHFDASVDTGDTVGWGSVTGPGGNVTVNIEALEDSDPVVGEEVDIILNWDSFTSDTAPFFSTTITTDANGTASTTMTVPENALDGVNAGGEAILEYNGTVYRESLYLDIEEYHIYTDTNWVPGEQGSIELNVVDQLTGEGVDNVPAQFEALRADYKTGTFATTQLVSGQDGTANTTIEVPADLGPDFSENNYVHRYEELSGNRFRVANLPGTLSVDTAYDGDDSWRTVAAPGENITLDFDTESELSASGVAITRAGRQGSFGTKITSEANATLKIPEFLEDGDDIRLAVWAADENGEFYQDDVYLEIAQPEEPTASFDVVANDRLAGPTLAENLTFNASDSTSPTGDLNYTWDFGDGTQTTTTDAVTEYSYDQSGEYTVELTVTNSDGQTATAAQTITVRETTTITGELALSDGQPAVNDTILGFNPDSNQAGLTVTNDDGTFELLVPKPLNGTPSNSSINVGYFQGDVRPYTYGDQDPAEIDIFPRDGHVDIFAFEAVDANQATYDAGAVELPAGHVLNTTVVALGDPVEDAALSTQHRNEAIDAWAGWFQFTNQDGQEVSGGNPGYELNGTVNVAAFAPNSSFDEPDATRTLNLTEYTEITLDIEGTPPSAVLAAPNRVTTGESFDLDASDSFDESGLESLTFTIYNESGSEVFSQQSPPSEPVVTTSLDATGNYTAELEVVDLSGQTNTTTATIEVRKGKNLAASVDVPTEQRVDEPLEATVTVENVGTGNINETIAVDVNASGTTYDTGDSVTLSDQFTIAGLDEGNATTETITFDLTADRLVGEVDVDVTADSDDAVEEVSEESNVDSDTVEITYANLDATINALDVARTGEDITLRSYVSNLGTAASDNTTANVTVTNASGTEVYTDEIQIGPLTPDDRARNTVGTSFNQTGTYTVAIDVNDQLFPEGTTAETNISIEAYDLTVAEDASEVPAELDAGTNSTVVFGFETNARNTVQATLDLSGTDAVTFPDGSETETLSVAPETGRTNIVAYNIRPDYAEAENVELTFSVDDTLAGVNEGDSVTESTSVAVPTERIRTESATTIDSGNTSDAIVELQAYGNNATDAQELEISLQGGTEGRTLQGLGYLANYPYGCVEQTTSAFLGALHIDEYYDDRSEDVTDSQQDTINGSIEKGLERLKEGGIRGQQPDGSWNQWGRSGQDGQSFFTSYALLGTASVENNDKHSQLNSQSLSEIRFNDAVNWVSDDNWNTVDGYLYDSVASTGFTLISLDEVEATGRLNDSTQQTLDEIYANASLELLSKTNDSVDTGVAWNGGYDDSTGPNPRSTALAVHGLQIALDANAHEVNDDLNESDLEAAVDGGVAWLLANQNDDGSWDPYLDSSWYNDIGDKSETTSAALLALNETGLENGLANESIVDGTDYLIDVYELGGSWGYPRATQASINALNELTDEGGVRTVDVTVTGPGGTETLGQYTVNATNQQETITISGSQLENVLHQEGTDTLQVEIGTVSDDGLTIVAGTVTQQVEVTAIEGDSQ